MYLISVNSPTRLRRHAQLCFLSPNPQPGSSLVSQKILVGATVCSHRSRYFSTIATSQWQIGLAGVTSWHCVTAFHEWCPRTLWCEIVPVERLAWLSLCFIFYFYFIFNKLENGGKYAYYIWIISFNTHIVQVNVKTGLQKLKWNSWTEHVCVVPGCWNKRQNIMFSLPAWLCPCFESVTSQMFIIESDVCCRVWGGPHGNSVCFGLMEMYYTHDTIIGW